MCKGKLKYPHLLSPLTIRGHVFRNRISFGPTLFAHAILTFPEIKENVYRMVEDRARGGAGEVTTGEICCNFEEGVAAFAEHPIDFECYAGTDFEALAEYATRIKKHGAVALLEFSHEGFEAQKNPPYDVWGPDAFVREDGVEVKAFTEEMMQKVCADFERMGRFARKAGFDGCLLHGGHGFLLQQFISPLMNHRTDNYGGSIENRARFPLRLLQSLRRGVGEDGIIELRFSAQDGQPGGMTIDDTVAFARIIDGIIDIFHVSNGLKAKGNSTGTFSGHYDPHALNAKYAKQIKKALTKTYVAVIGGINDPEQCEMLIANNTADLVVLGRQGFADPEFANKVMDDKADHIRRCLRCFSCYPANMEHPTDIPIAERGLTDEQLSGMRISRKPGAMGWCTVNPDSGFDRTPFDQLLPCTKCQRVTIIGGGPAGMQAAITAKQRGHQVTLYEKSARLGGTVRAYAAADPDKKDILHFIDLLEKETYESAGVYTGVEVTPLTVCNDDCDVLIIAIGAQPKKIELQGYEYARNLLDAYHDTPHGKIIALVGAGLSACETAVFLAKAGNQVKIVLRGTMLAKECYGGARNALMTEIERLPIEILMDTPCYGFSPDGVITNGKTISCDNIYIAFGTQKNPLVDALKSAWGNRPVSVIGDCQRPGQIGAAVHGGYDAAIAIG